MEIFNFHPKNDLNLLGVIFFLHSLSFHIFSQTPAIKEIKTEGAGYPFLCYEPVGYSKDSSFQWPLMVFLHGRSLSGTDLNKIRKYGLIAETDKGRNFPAIIIAPQIKQDESWNPDKIISCIDQISFSHKIDTNRISITGMSLGGYGTLHTAGKYPHKFSAAAAFCGGGNQKDSCRLSSIPLWIAHGKKDVPVPFSESEKMVTSIKSCNNRNIRFSIFEDHGHGDLERMFQTEELYDFLLKNQKGKPCYFPEFNTKSLK